MAEGLLREELKLRGMGHKISVSSAGTHVTLPGHMADARAQLVCAREGIDLRKCRARQVTSEDFLRFDYLLAMDQRNFEWLHESCPALHRSRISMLGSWAEESPVGDILDPYYGSPAGFEEVLRQLHRCVGGFLAHLDGMRELEK